MTFFKKIIIAVVALPILGFVAYYFYLMWPAMFPKFEKDSCVIDTKVNRIHKITGFDDRMKGSGVPTVVLVSGIAVPGTHEVGTVESIRIDDPEIQSVKCP